MNQHVKKKTLSEHEGPSRTWRSWTRKHFNFQYYTWYFTKYCRCCRNLGQAGRNYSFLDFISCSGGLSWPAGRKPASLLNCWRKGLSWSILPVSSLQQEVLDMVKFRFNSLGQQLTSPVWIQFIDAIIHSALQEKHILDHWSWSRNSLSFFIVK